jgi:hypothetical protein
MTIKGIAEISNPNNMTLKPIKEVQDIYIPDVINQNISRRNGMVYALSGSGGSGKTSLLLNMFKSKLMYRNRFNNIYYICPSSSFLSVHNHPFEKHDKVYHELTVEILEGIYNELIAKKEAYAEYFEKKKNKKNKKDKIINDEEGQESEEEEEPELEYSCIIMDDMASSLKDNDINKQLNKMIIKARHIMCGFIFTLQSYLYFPKILRKQLTYITIFKPKNVEEWNSAAQELMNVNKDDALTIFNYVFSEPYAHIDIDLVNNKYYKNFNELKIET